MIFKYVLICGVHMAESLLVGHNFVSGICELNLKTYIKNLKMCFKNLGFYHPVADLFLYLGRSAAARS